MPKYFKLDLSYMVQLLCFLAFHNMPLNLYESHVASHIER